MSDRERLPAGLRVLVAEDEYLVAREIRSVLVTAGCGDVRLAASLADAESIASAGDVHAALLDVKLGERVVYPLAERLERLGVPVIFVTGYATEAIPPHLAHLPLIQKPFPHARLLTTLRQAVAGHTRP